MTKLLNRIPANSPQAKYRHAQDASQSAYENVKDAAQSAYEATKDVAKSTLETTKDVAQSTLGTTKDVAQSTYGNVQHSVKSGMSKTQGALAAGAGTAAVLLHQGQKYNDKNAKKAQKNLGIFQSRAHDAYDTSSKLAQKNLKKNQQRLEHLQRKVQDNVVPGLVATQDTLSKKAKKANKNLQDAASNVQKQYAHYQQKRQRAKTLFRFGIVAGVVAALLLTPLTGSEVRKRIADLWSRGRSYFEL
jgi:hypothetical protein